MKSVLFLGFLFSFLAQASTQWSGYRAELKNDLGTTQYEVRFMQKFLGLEKVAFYLKTTEKNSAHTFYVNTWDFEKTLNIFKNCQTKNLGKVVTVKTQAGEFQACRVKTVTDNSFLEHTAWYIEGLWVPVKSVYRYDRQRKLGQTEEVTALF